jgi:hypothetical protein
MSGTGACTSGFGLNGGAHAGYPSASGRMMR